MGNNSSNSTYRKKKKKQQVQPQFIQAITHAPATQAHQHHGLFHWIKEKYYNKYWLPWLTKVSNWTGGRANSGQVARRARLIRIAMNVISIAAILTFIVFTGGFSAGAFVNFWNTGAELPLTTTIGLVAASVTMISMVINMFEVQIGTAANFAKIQQYTHAELTNEEWLNEKRAVKRQIPHFWESTFDKKVMLFVRYAHDFNGLVGSAMSSYLCLACAVAYFTPWSLPLTLLSASILFVASRASSLASVTLAPFTNQLRLTYYKNRLDAQANEYYYLHLKANPKQASLITRIITRAFNETTIAAIPKLPDRVKFLCYRACEAAIGDKPLAERDVDITVIMIRVTIERHFKQPKAADVSYFEDLYLLQAELEEKLKKPTLKQAKADHESLTKTIELRPKYPERLLEQEFCANLTDTNKKAALKQITRSPYLISKAGRPYVIDQQRAIQDFPLESNTHGEEFVPAYHCKKIVETLVASPRIKEPAFI